MCRALTSDEHQDDQSPRASSVVLDCFRKALRGDAIEGSFDDRPSGQTDGTNPVRRPAFMDDREWLRAHQLEPISSLDVAEGGMGAVVLARHLGMRRDVVLKSAFEAYNEERSRREIEIHARLGGHPNIAVMRTPLIYRETAILVVDHIPGPNLKQLIHDRGPIAWRETCDLIRQAAHGLAHAHDRGLIHRDIKPSNLVISQQDGAISLIDWGLGLHRRQSSDWHDTELTIPGQFLGTPSYCPPEQAVDATAASPASDLYGIGCVLHELLTGKPPFEGDRRALALAHAHASVKPLPASLAIPRGVERMLRKLLEKTPDRRFQSARELIAAIDLVLTRPDEKGKTARIRPFAMVAVIAMMLIGWDGSSRGGQRSDRRGQLLVRMPDPRRTARLESSPNAALSINRTRSRDACEAASGPDRVKLDLSHQESRIQRGDRVFDG